MWLASLFNIICDHVYYYSLCIYYKSNHYIYYKTKITLYMISLTIQYHTQLYTIIYFYRCKYDGLAPREYSGSVNIASRGEHNHRICRGKSKINCFIKWSEIFPYFARLWLAETAFTGVYLRVSWPQTALSGLFGVSIFNYALDLP